MNYEQNMNTDTCISEFAIWKSGLYNEEDMFTTVVFLLEKKWIHVTTPQTQEAECNFAEFGIACRVVCSEELVENNVSSAAENGTEDKDAYVLSADLISVIDAVPCQECLAITDSARLRSIAESYGMHPMGYSHACNRKESFQGLSYVLEEPQWLDRDSLTKLYERAHGLPWEILRTQHCIVREFTAEDVDDIYALYDDVARRFLTPPSEDREKEREILTAYCDRVYGLFGYGQWAVLDVKTGELIGRMGYSFPTRDKGDKPECDVVFGYLMKASHRGRGLTMEVCRALLAYGENTLGFETIFAEASVENTASREILSKLDFAPAGISESGEMRYFLRKSRGFLTME